MTPFSSLAMRRYSIEPRTRKYVKEYGVLSFASKYKKKLLQSIKQMNFLEIKLQMQ